MIIIYGIYASHAISTTASFSLRREFNQSYSIQQAIYNPAPSLRIQPTGCANRRLNQILSGLAGRLAAAPTSETQVIASADVRIQRSVLVFWRASFRSAIRVSRCVVDVVGGAAEVGVNGVVDVLDVVGVKEDEVGSV
jgi:hypothetical protein